MRFLISLFAIEWMVSVSVAAVAVASVLAAPQSRSRSQLDMMAITTTKATPAQGI